MPTAADRPTFRHEDLLAGSRQLRIAGCDEAGRGPLAAGVYAGAVILDRSNVPEGLHDSKKLSPARRERLFEEIMAKAAVSIGVATAAEIDAINIRNATFLAMRRAIEGLSVKPDAVLVDGNASPPGLDCHSQFLIKGDALSLSIAAASIIAKVAHDREMLELARLHPQYGFEVHMGYPTKSHIEAIALHGPSPVHRMTFGPLKAYA